MNKSNSISVSLDDDAFAIFQDASQIVNRAGIRVPAGQLVQVLINAEISRLSSQKIAQRFLKTVMQQVGVLAERDVDDDESTEPVTNIASSTANPTP